MKDLLEIALSGFWSFVGSWVLLSLPFDAIRYCWKYWLRSRNIKHHGWPPRGKPVSLLPGASTCGSCFDCSSPRG